MKPVSIGIVFCEKRFPNPIRISSLQHLHAKDYLHLSAYANFSHTHNLYFTACGGHAWTTNRTIQSTDLCICLSEDLPGSLQRELKMILSTCISFHKHIIRDHTHIDLGFPHLSPHVSRIVDVFDQWRLSSDLCTGGSYPPHCLSDSRCF